MAADPARRPRRCPPSRRGGGHRLRRRVRRPGGADRRSDLCRGHPTGRHGGSRPAARAGERVRGGQRTRGRPTDPFHVERLTSPLPALAEAAAGLAPFPLPKVPVQVSRYWTFKAGAGNAPSLPVVAFHVFARDAHGPLVELLKAAGAHPGGGRGARRRHPGLRGRRARRPRRAGGSRSTTPRPGRDWPTAIAGAASPPPDARVRRLLERLVRLYTGPDSPYLDFYGPPRTIPTIPYDRALARLATRDGGLDVRGKAVFIGLSSHTGAEQRDGVNTIFSEANGLDLSGVEVAATAFANIAEARSVEPAPIAAEVVLAVAWGLALGFLAWRLPLLASATLLPLAGVLYLMVARNRFTATGLWLPLVGPLAVQITVALAASALWRHRDTRREREHLSTALAHYLPPKIAEELAREIGDVRAVDQLVYGTCLSTDAHQYTTLSETMAPAELGALMNRYYAVLFEPVKRHGGLVQDVVGDSMLAIWATTEPDLSLRSRACLAALDIATAVDRFNAASGRLALPTRIGLHSGRLLLGSVGAMDHYEYRAVGDIVNTATRLEGLNKHLGTRLLVGAEALQGLEGLMSRELGAFLLAGKSRPIVVHELIARAADATAVGQGALCYLCRGSGRLPAWSLARGHAALGRSAPRARRRGWAQPLLPPFVRDSRRRAAARRLGRRRAHGPEVAGEPRDRPLAPPEPWRDGSGPRRQCPARGRGRLPGLGGANGLHPGPGRGAPRRGAPVGPGADRHRALPGGRGPAGPAQPSGHRLARRRRRAPRPEHHDHVHAAAGASRYVARPPDRRRPLLHPDAAAPPHHDAVRQRVRRRNRVPGRGGADRGAHLRVGGAGPRRERAGLPLARGRAVGGGARRSGADPPADRREADRRRGLGSLLSPGPRPAPGRLPRPARRDVAAAGPPLHRGSRPGRPRRRPGQRRGHSGHRQRSSGVRAPGRAARPPPPDRS